MKLTILTILSVRFSNVKYIHILVKKISKTFSFCKSETIPIKQQLRILSPWPQLLVTIIVLCFYEFDYFRYFISGIKW